MVYSKYAGTELKVSGTEYVILKVCSQCFPWRAQAHAGAQRIVFPVLCTSRCMSCPAPECDFWRWLPQEDDVIGILSTDNITDLKPLGDRILVEVSGHASKT